MINITVLSGKTGWDGTFLCDKDDIEDRLKQYLSNSPAEMIDLNANYVII